MYIFESKHFKLSLIKNYKMFSQNESNKNLLAYALTYILKIKYKLKVIINNINKSNGTILVNRREYNLYNILL